MTKENLIFLGACTIMSSSPYATTKRDGNSYSATEAKLILDRAVDWSTSLYELVHSQSAPEPEEQWEVQANFSTGWARSGNDGLNRIFNSYEAANEAMQTNKGYLLEYRVRRLN